MGYQNLDWKQATDILLISFLLYRVVVLFRRSHALQILAALAFLYGMEVASRQLGLVLTNWFFQAIGPIVVLILVVVFRNELREVLLQSSPARLILGDRPDAGRVRLDQLSSAVFDLAGERIGALIVLRGRNALYGAVREGLRLDAAFDPRVLRSVFHKESPLHDGALVIVGDQITRVGALLPLSLRPDLPPDYGTRHRAALGLSELTDAVVLVVSEERGEVALVHRSMVLNPETPEELENSLRAHWGAAEGERLSRRRLLSILRQLFGYVLTTLAVALAWGLLLGREPSIIAVNAPIDFRNVPDGLELSRVSVESVDVQIRAQQVLLDALDPSRVRVSVDLADRREGAGQVVRLSAEDVVVPPGFEVDQLRPAEITISLDRRGEYRLLIVPRLIGELPAGLRIRSYAVEPRTLAVNGPESVFASGEALATTAPIDLSQVPPGQTSLSRTVDVVVFPASVRPRGATPPRANVRINLEALPAEAPP